MLTGPFQAVRGCIDKLIVLESVTGFLIHGFRSSFARQRAESLRLLIQSAQRLNSISTMPFREYQLTAAKGMCTWIYVMRGFDILSEPLLKGLQCASLSSACSALS